MERYAILADSGCDIPAGMLESWGIRAADMTFSFDGEDRVYRSGELPPEDFYARMREGAVARTSAVNAAAFAELFEGELKQGADVLYLGVSGALSRTCDSARMAAQELREKYPDRRIAVVDTLCVSLGYGMLLFLAARKKNAGADFREVVRFVEATRPRVCHWFTVEDLTYLKRGGRVSATAAALAGVLGIRPVLRIAGDGRAESAMKVRGRLNSIRALAERYGALAEPLKDNTVFIGHGDCVAEARELAGMLARLYGVRAERIMQLGPVIGAHSGPGTVALFFLGKSR